MTNDKDLDGRPNVGNGQSESSVFDSTWRRPSVSGTESLELSPTYFIYNIVFFLITMFPVII